MSVLRNTLQRAASSLQALPEANGWQRQYVFDAGSAVFAGHFPQYPVLPAVVQILMAQMTLEEALGRPFDLCAITQAKFTAPMEPGAVIALLVQQGRRADLWDCTLRCDGQFAARFQIATQAESV
jgi:3-hydroxyacyl-[acyl-carrier-protein] dehydratase